MFINGKNNSFQNFKDFFKETTLSDDEIWLLCDYMQSFYVLKETAAVLKRGYSHFTERAKLPELTSPKLSVKINHEMLPAIFAQIDKLLSE